MPEFNIEAWVNNNLENKPFRQAVHTILYSISSARELQEIMVMKGGILIALRYESTRFTRDIDFSSDIMLHEFDAESFIEGFDAALVEAVDKLEYDVDCLVQGWKQQPPREDATFPTFRIRVGYANRSDRRMHRRLLRKESQHVVKVDFSLNEPRGDPELFEIDEGKSIQIYSFHDLVGEKYRALLQQAVRNRQRRQDVYDLYLLIESREYSSDESVRSKILHSLKEKAAARQLVIDQESMRNPEIIRRSRQNYSLLKSEIEGTLPEFDESYEMVKSFYEDLPWD